MPAPRHGRSPRRRPDWNGWWRARARWSGCGAARRALRPERIDVGRPLEETVDRFAPGGAAAGIELGGAWTMGRPPTTGSASRPTGSPSTGSWATSSPTRSRPSTGRAATSGSTPAGRGRGRRGARDRRSRVIDDGPGFPPGGTERAFERFYRGDPSRSGSGSGLGLAIVRELARAHGGKAVAENVAPHGARVSVVLPQTPRPAQD